MTPSRKPLFVMALADDHHALAGASAGPEVKRTIALKALEPFKQRFGKSQAGHAGYVLQYVSLLELVAFPCLAVATLVKFGALHVMGGAAALADAVSMASLV